MQFKSTFTFLSIVGLVSALAVERRQASPDAQSPEQFEAFAQFSFASYCRELHDGKVDTAVCTTDKQGTPCAGFGDVKTTAEFTGDGKNGIGGYVAVDKAQGRIVVALKGTDNIKEIGTDIAIAQVDSDLCDGCKVHEGFNEGFKSVKAQLETALRAETDKPGQQAYRVVVAGHSLGASVAMLAGASLRKQGVALDMYLYGCPFVGNAKFAEFVASQPGLTARITNKDDLVPAVPKRGIPPQQTYEHVFPEFWYERGLALPGLYRAAGPRVCRSAAECTSADCSKPQNGLLLSGCNLTDHGLYAGGAGFRPCAGEPDALGTALASLKGGRRRGAGG
ncbi:lipase (class 3) domain-containing protein [Hirsutella rhossiliensis]|uniref:Lipase (Class 3) domain-containing protein n=1 Tax=Hirsutella rhossiliensis TaxID=111463 RepID=A0A9P8N6R2_9HYPO|nr:lipase (class 3) domain-containing protein [Hirsutella rhossiliensis]KAH0965667.1 lipase (class 3) domain-containing protein [Hirsutella rhossiliensis]